MSALTLALIVTAYDPARFVLEVTGIPVAELRIGVEGGRYLYATTHFLEEDPAPTQKTFELRQWPLPFEVMELSVRPLPGCRDVTEERSAVVERLCVDHETSPGAEVTGTLAGQRFVAQYDAHSKLSDITVGASHWVAVKGPTRAALNPFAKGVPVPSGPLALSPHVPGARWVKTVRGIGAVGSVGRARCLPLARAAVKEPGHRARRIAVGVVIEGGRAYPHAWVVEHGLDLDPSVLAQDQALTSRRYLEIPRPDSGAFFLRLFDGTVRLVKR
jgi:hypothetical protein